MESRIGEKNKQSARSFFTALENENLEAMMQLFADGAVHKNPYASGLFPEIVMGKQEIYNYWAPVFQNFKKMKFPIEEIYAMENPAIVYLKFKGLIGLKGGAGTYENDYYSIFRFNQNGEIIEYEEIFNPITAARGFGLLDKIK